MMQILNLTNIEKSNIKYTISHFPDGEVQITLDKFSRKDPIKVMCRITNAEELFLVKQVLDILDRNEVVYDVFISYLMGMRMDRVMDFNRPFTLKIVTDILTSSKAKSFDVLEPHSGRTVQLLEMYYELLPPDIIPNEMERCQLVIPDAGAKERYEDRFFYGLPEDTIFCSKARDIETGRITSIQIDNPEQISNKPMLIIDDLCDGGGTFLGIAEAIRKINPDAEINISVVHMVNQKGIENLSKTFNHVYFTNSYKDWKSSLDTFPDNVTQIDVI